MSVQPVCFLAQFSSTPCNGRLVKAHLIPRSLLKREFPFGAYYGDGLADRIPEAHRRTLVPNATEAGGFEVRHLDAMMEDTRGWVWACGGIVGNTGHHGMLDASRTLRIPRDRLPAALEEFAAELGLGWWVDRTYGPLDEERAA